MIAQLIFDCFWQFCTLCKIHSHCNMRAFSKLRWEYFFLIVAHLLNVGFSVAFGSSLICNLGFSCVCSCVFLSARSIHDFVTLRYKILHMLYFIIKIMITIGSVFSSDLSKTRIINQFKVMASAKKDERSNERDQKPLTESATQGSKYLVSGVHKWYWTMCGKYQCKQSQKSVNTMSVRLSQIVFLTDFEER